jgi:hypothetical protein
MTTDFFHTAFTILNGFAIGAVAMMIVLTWKRKARR